MVIKPTDSALDLSFTELTETERTQVYMWADRFGLAVDPLGSAGALRVHGTLNPAEEGPALDEAFAEAAAMLRGDWPAQG